MPDKKLIPPGRGMLAAPRSPMRLVAVLCLSVFVIELLLMVLFQLLPPMPGGVEDVLDAGLLTLLLIPVSYFLIFRPMTQQIAAREQALQEQKAGEEALRQANRFRKHILNAIGDGICGVNSTGHITFINPVGAAMLQRAPEDMVGQSIRDIAYSKRADGTPYPRGECPICMTLEDGIPRHDDNEVFWRRDGGSFPVEYSSMPMHDGQGRLIGMVVSFIEITERRRAEERLRIAASVFTHVREGIGITDTEGNVLDVNAAFTRITGYEREEVLGRNMNILHSGRQSEEFYRDMWRALIENGYWAGELWNRRKNGEVYSESIAISAVSDARGERQGYVAVFSDSSLLKEHERQLEYIAHYDALTGVPNRVLLADRMKQAIAQTMREQNMLAICYLDLDGFKDINDTMGHEAGDQVLIEVSRRIGGTIRGGDTVARLGGDEFVVLLLGLERGEECTASITRLLEAISQPIKIGEKPVVVGASIGVSIYPLDDDDPDTLLRHADQAMYMAKQAGKNRFHVYDPALDQRARNHHAFMFDIQHALERSEFVLHYQPKLDLRTRQVVGAEALIRWQHPQKGLLSPAEFLRAIENTDLDIRVGEWVTSTALAQAQQWLEAGLDIEVSINISAHHLESEGFVEGLRLEVARYPGLPAGRLQIEILETIALDDIAVVSGIISSCRGFGVGFALDDFGTGYSSLTYLNHLPVDALKIDQSFVRDMIEDKGDRAIVKGIIALARAFDRLTVAEGIETDKHYEALLKMDCNFGQGYAIARPMPAEEFVKWYARHTGATARQGDA
jgi:diguanylate cyclase (GGDEF)-like protein/PAS domain S-box-containing protein